MVSLARAERKAARFVKDVKDLDVDDLYDQLDSCATMCGSCRKPSASVRATNMAAPATMPRRRRKKPRT
jgi:hypothetical protein